MSWNVVITLKLITNSIYQAAKMIDERIMFQIFNDKT